ncbi:hypothetical protein [Acaryochloris marina]|uniref:hypothetical protein n=1 Tax=Acaryochloris marina TaxID=155978 RepID=UPI00059F3553|nr:hypothetical protein [Acaryochloris marina]
MLSVWLVVGACDLLVLMYYLDLDFTVAEQLLSEAICVWGMGIGQGTWNKRTGGSIMPRKGWTGRVLELPWKALNKEENPGIDRRVRHPINFLFCLTAQAASFSQRSKAERESCFLLSDSYPKALLTKPYSQSRRLRSHHRTGIFGHPASHR